MKILTTEFTEKAQRTPRKTNKPLRLEDVYTLVYEAFAGQKSMHLDIFPFRMDAAHIKKYASSGMIDFWNLRPGYALFERNHIPAEIGINGVEYKFRN